MSMRVRRRVILDTDPGVDDALAILLALRSPELEIVAMTTVCGNVPVDQATRNLLRIVGLVKPQPALLIGQGAAKPLVWPLATATYFHGSDGLGELERFRHPDGSSRYPEPSLPRTLPTAQQVWTDCIRRYPDDLTLITLGPLTNLARALQADPSMARRFRAVICMAGAIAVPGNITPAAEFNVYVDPHAAERVLEFGLPMTLVPLDVTMQVALTRENIHALTARDSDVVGRFLRDATTPALDYMQRVEGRAVFHLHDPLAVAVAISPDLVRTIPLHVAVETDGRVTRGMTVANRRSKASETPPPNVQVALTVDAKQALELFEKRLCRR